MATAIKQPAAIRSHDSDFYGWALDTAAAIRTRQFKGVDWEAVAEELEDMGRSERRALESRFEILLAHLLKWSFQPAQRSTSWSGTIKEQSRKAERLLQQNPGLLPLVGEILNEAYHSAKAVAERDTGIDESRFPAPCPWTVAEVLDEGFWPDACNFGSDPY